MSSNEEAGRIGCFFFFFTRLLRLLQKDDGLTYVVTCEKRKNKVNERILVLMAREQKGN